MVSIERLQELIARASMAESMEISKENMDEYREILRMAMMVDFEAFEKAIPF